MKTPDPQAKIMQEKNNKIFVTGILFAKFIIFSPF